MEMTENYRPTNPTSINSEDNILYKEIENLLTEGKYQKALELVEDQWVYRKKDPFFLMTASQVYKGASQSEKEKNCLSDLVSISPKAIHKYLLAECLSAQENYPESLKILHEIIDTLSSKDPVYFDTLKSMGNIYLKCGDIAAAEEKYNQANRINSGDQGLMVNYGVLAIQKGEYGIAKEKFTEAIYMNSKHDVAWVGLALVHRAYSDFDLSRACLLRALDENSTNKIAVIHFYQWCEEDSVDVSIDRLDYYLNIYPEDPEVLKLYRSMNS